jgi:hypothetical protein
LMFGAGVRAHPARGRDRAFFSESGRALVTGVTRHARGQHVRGSGDRAHSTFGITVERSHGKLYDFGIKRRGSLVNPAYYDTAPSSRMGVAGRDGARVPQALRKSADGRVVITVLAREFAIANASSAAKPK